MKKTWLLEGERMFAQLSRWHRPWVAHCLGAALDMPKCRCVISILGSLASRQKEEIYSFVEESSFRAWNAQDQVREAFQDFN